MPEIDTKIWMALRNRINALSMASPDWAIAWPGGNYSPVGNVSFLAIGEVIAQPVRRVINRNIQDRTGSLMVSAVMPIGQDPSVYKEYAGKIAAHFQGCADYSDVRLHFMSSSGGKSYANAGYRDGAWWRVPVTIPWRTWQ